MTSRTPVKAPIDGSTIAAPVRMRTLGFVAMVILCAIRLLTLPTIPLGHSWLDGAICGAGVLATVGLLCARLPAQNWWAAMAIMGVLGGAVEWGVGGGIALPWAAALWIAGLVIARGTTARALRSWRKSPVYGFWLIGIAGLLGALFLSTIQTVGAQQVFWTILIRIPAAWGILAAATPFLITKRPAPEVGDWESTGCWIALSAVVACAAALQGAWAVSGITAVAATLAAALGIRQPNVS